MAKKKNTEQNADDALFEALAEATDGDILGKMDSVKYFVDTGSLAVNFICSGKFIHGGIPGGKITEIYGASSSGKSLIAANVLHGCQKLGGFPVILDCENATNGEFMAKTSHLNLLRVIRYTPMSLEQAFLKIHNVAKKIREKVGVEIPLVFIYDSISVSPCERELKETELPENYKPSDWKKLVGRQEQPGERAKVCSKELRKLQAVMEEMNITLVVLNQTREKIGVMYGNPETTAGGGNALPFYASCRLRTATRKKIENKRLETFAGVNMHVKNVKNRSFRPFVESEGIKLYFDTGVNPISGLLSCFINGDRVKPGSAGNYEVAEEFLPDNTPSYKFKAARANNDVPLQVLFDCPKLIDARTTEEVREYLNPFMDSITNSESDDFEEKAVSFDVDGNPIESGSEEE
jgi:recombination protein RecA